MCKHCNIRVGMGVVGVGDIVFGVSVTYHSHSCLLLKPFLF